MKAGGAGDGAGSRPGRAMRTAQGRGRQDSHSRPFTEHFRREGPPQARGLGSRQATHHPWSQPWGCEGRSRLPNAPYLCRPLSMKHTSPQLLSPSSFSTSASTAASMVPATGSGDLTGGQHWVRDPGTRLLGARWYSPGVGGGAKTLPPTDAGTFPPRPCRKAGGSVSTQCFGSFYGICVAALGLAVEQSFFFFSPGNVEVGSMWRHPVCFSVIFFFFAITYCLQKMVSQHLALHNFP